MSIDVVLTDTLDGVMTHGQIGHLNKVFKGIFRKAINSVKHKEKKQKVCVRHTMMAIKVKLVSCLLLCHSCRDSITD